MTHQHHASNTLIAGTPVASATGAVLLLHGRGGHPQDLISLAGHLDTEGLALVAPAATARTWYPHSFLAPEAQNQPGLDSALTLVHQTLEELEQSLGSSEHIYMMGFSQGACLTLEAAARRPKRYGGVFALSGGLIGLGVNQRTYTGSLDSTPVFLGCSDIDPHIPLERVEASTQVLEQLGGEVKEVIYPGFGHTVNQDELNHIQQMMS